MNHTLRPPLGSAPLKERLSWTAGMDDKLLESYQTQSMIQSSDHVQKVTIPFSIRRQLNFATQIQLISRVHTRRKEHLVLDQAGAQFFLDDPELARQEAIGGEIRSEAFPLPVYMTNIMRSPKPEDVPDLYNRLIAAAENLFPYEAINPNVDTKNVYHYLSAIQFIFILIHPFADANGRVSEDMLYALWGRRPDLFGSVRHATANGKRNNFSVRERDAHIQLGAAMIIQKVARKMGIKNTVYSYDELPDNYLLGHKERSQEEFDNLYFTNLYKEINNLLSLLDGNHLDALRQDRTIDTMAINLQLASRNYTFADKTRISYPTTQRTARMRDTRLLGQVIGLFA
jgi:hypothetical protein